MYTSSVENNPFLKYQQTDSTEAADTSTAPVAIDFSSDASQTSTGGVTTPDSVKPLPLVNSDSLKKGDTGLTVETSKKPTLDSQTRKWFGMSQAQWDALSDEEKQAKTEIALKGIVDSYNKYQKEIGSDKRLTYAKQVELYRDRMAAGSHDQVKRLTSSVKALHGKDQSDAIKVAYQYKDDDNRDVAEKTIAEDYTDYDKENVVAAAKETRYFSVKNQTIAAENAPYADVSQHKELVDTFMASDNEDVQTALAKNVGNFGVDNDGNIDDEGRKIQASCFKQITASEYDSVLTTAADNIDTMDKYNQADAFQDIVDTGNTDAINEAKSQFEYYDEEAKPEIKSMIDDYNSDNTSAYLEDTDEPESDVADVDQSEWATESGVDLLENPEMAKPTEIEEFVKNATDDQKKEFLEKNPEYADKMLYGASPELTNQIIEILNKSNLSIEKRDSLLAALSESKVLEGTNSKLGSLDSSAQTAFVNNTTSLTALKSLDTTALEPTARKAYETRLAELKEKEQEKTGTTKFGILKFA